MTKPERALNCGNWDRASRPLTAPDSLELLCGGGLEDETGCGHLLHKAFAAAGLALEGAVDLIIDR